MNPHCPVGIYWQKDLWSKVPPHLVAIKKIKLSKSISFDIGQKTLVSNILKLRHENIAHFDGLVVLTLRNVAFRISEYCSKGQSFGEFHPTKK